MADQPKYYWDACSWIALIQQEPGRFEALKYAIEQAKEKKVQIWTSMFTLAEVFKRPCDGQQKGLQIVQDTEFEDYILQDFIERVQVDFSVGRLARGLLRAYPTMGKPQDAIHVATALLNNVDELHTFDRENLLGLSGKLTRKDGKTLRICHPPKPPLPEPKEAPKDELGQADMFSQPQAPVNEQPKPQPEKQAGVSPAPAEPKAPDDVKAAAEDPAKAGRS